MGYRSDVTAVFYCHKKEDYAPMKLFVEENLLINSKWMQENTKEEVSAGDNKYMCFRGEDVKWYESYADVQLFNEFIKAFKELADEDGGELTWAYEFVRIGEELDDIHTEESDGAMNVLNVYRGVDVAF
jgi:hypothetical protein